MEDVLDLRGLSCPIPLIKTKEALNGKAEVQLLVDEAAPRENILKFARSQGYQASVSEAADGWRLNISKS